MNKMVARLNIERFKRQLAEECDERKRQVLTRLLAEEEAKLRDIERAVDESA
jgi:hypothetical protein